MIGFALTDLVIHHPAQPRAAIILHTKSFDIYPAYISRDIVAVRLTNRFTDLYVISVYAPPHDDLNTTLTTLTDICTKFHPTPILIGGDFNAKNVVWGGNRTDDRGAQLAEFIIARDLLPLNTPESPPTFESARGCSWIDITLASQNIVRDITNWTVLSDTTGSDHNYIFIQAYNNNTTTTKKLTKSGQKKLLTQMSQDQWFTRMQTTQIHSLTLLKHIIDTMYNKLKTLYDKYSKYVKNSTHQYPWWTPDLDTERKRVRALRRRYQHSQDHLRNIHKTLYIQAHKTYKINIKQAKLKSWHEFCTLVHRSNIFTIPYKIAFNKIKKPTLIPPITRSDGTITNTLQDSVRCILETQFPQHQPEPQTAVHEEIIQSIQTQPNTPDDIPFTQHEIKHIIQHIPSRITPGLDNMSASLMKSLYSLFPNFFHSIFNACLTFSYYPDLWKESKVVLLPKPNKPTNQPTSYRPICINPLLGKVLEKLLYNRLYYFLHHNNLLHPFQFGFTHNTSATIALYHIKQKLKSAIAEQKKTLIISLDISNAFNTIWIPFVLQYFKQNLLPRNLYLLLQAILNNRTITYPLLSQSVSLNTPVGSPQGSPLSPLIWNVLISSLLDLPFPSNTHVQAYADDITIIITGNTRLHLETTANTTLNTIYNWGKEHNINFNPSKCKFTLIGRHYLKRPPTIKIGNHSLTHTQEMKILGVIFDSKLSFLPHANHLRDTIYKHTVALAAFSGRNWGITPTHFRDLYTRSLERIITYGAPIYWQTENNTHLTRKLTSIQRIPLLKICKAFHTVSNNSLRVLTNTLPIQYTLNRETALFHLFQLRTDYTYNNTEYKTSDLQHDTPIWNIHPGLLPHFPFTTTPTHPTTHMIFTDGSVYKDTVGSAYVIMDTHYNITYFDKFKLPSHTTIYDAELIAIHRALQKILEQPQTFTYTLYSDSYSSLQAIANPYNIHPTVLTIKLLLQQLSTSHTIHLVHIRSHTNNIGNDIADKFANEARNSGTLITHKFTKHYIRKTIRKSNYTEWNKHWTEHCTESPLFTWIPSIHNIPDHFPSTYYTTQILTNHGRFPYYFLKHNKTTDDTCPCGEQCSSFTHYTTTCTLTTHYRTQLIQLLPQGLNNITKPKVVHDREVMDLLGKMVQHISNNLPHR